MGCACSASSFPGSLHRFGALRNTKAEDLTPRQKYILRETWNSVVEAYRQDLGISVFKRFLTMNPELKIYFKEFRSVPISEITDRHGHPNRLMTAIDEAVKEMGNSDTFYAYLYELGIRHGGFKLVISRTHFDDLRKCFVSCIMALLDGTIPFDNIEVEKAWTALFCTISTVMLKGISQHHSV
ncbi:cytoglobin-2-like [Exaiptasia diaphana]|uniref:Globin domain-containing protein n=1 Tax=Exaiptasia diaphana TaxID=2652724 RepID=A0A913XW69_EXADI|nr:cytoglobin-2-like [Exaiptasia diaphana]